MKYVFLFKVLTSKILNILSLQKAIEKSFTRSAVEFFYKKETLKSRTTAAFWYMFVLAGILTSGKMIHANCQRYINLVNLKQPLG